MTVDTHDRLEMRWVPVTDPGGRTRMESIWVSPADLAAHATQVTHAA